MNENNLPGDVIGIGSSIAPEGMEKRLEILDSVNAQYFTPDGILDTDAAWQELMKHSLPDITEFFRHTVTLRMDSEYAAYTELINGKSPDVSPPDTLTATWNTSAVDIAVTFWSLPDYSGLGFWLDTDGKRSWHVLRSKSWSGHVIDTQQLSLELGERITPDQINTAKLQVDMHLSGEHESGITLFSTEILQRISKRNMLLRFTAAPTVGIEYADPGQDVIAHNPIELAAMFTGTPHNERESVMRTSNASVAVELHKMSVPGYDQQIPHNLAQHSSVNAQMIFNATVGLLIQNDLTISVFKLDDICKAVSRPEWSRANADDRRRFRTDTLHTLLFGSWIRQGKDILSIVTVDGVHLNESNEPESVTLSIPRLMEQKMIQRRGQTPQLESEYSRKHFSTGTLEAIGYLPGGSETSRGHKSYARGIAFWMALREAVSRGSERSFIRQQMLGEVTIRPTLKTSLNDKTHKVRIVEYYCKALYSLLNVPDEAKEVQILDYGDAAIIREHSEPYKRLQAWIDYESTGSVDRWLKQRVTLRVASLERSLIADELKNRQIKRASRVIYSRKRKR